MCRGIRDHRVHGIAVALLLWCATGAGAAGTTAANFLKFAPGARNVAMGETGAAGSGYDTAYWNPAGLAAWTCPAASVMHASGLYDIAFEHAAVARPFRWGVLGLSVDHLSMPAIRKYDNTGLRLADSFRPQDTAVTVSYARTLRSVLAGVSAKIVSSSIDGTGATAYAADLGAQYPVSDRWVLGASVHNAGTAMTFVSAAHPLPFTVRGGAEYQHGRVSLAADLTKSVDTDPACHAGAEYRLPVGAATEIAARGGYKTDIKGLEGLAGITAGIGIAHRSISFDYAIVSYGDLDTAQRLSLSYVFDPVPGVGE